MSLPEEKIEKLSDKFVSDIEREVKRTLKELREFEVCQDDIVRVLKDGYKKASKIVIIPGDKR